MSNNHKGSIHSLLNTFTKNAQKKGLIQLKSILKILIPITLPIVLLILSFMILIKVPELSGTLQTVIHYVSYALFLIGMVLSYCFNKSRGFFIILTLFISQILLMEYTPSQIDLAFYFHSVFAVISVMVPMNLFIFSIIKERGILTLWGKLRIGWIIAQLAFTMWLVLSKKIEFIQFFTYPIIDMDLSILAPLAQPSLLMFLVVFIVMIVRQVMKESFFESSLLGVLLAVFFSFRMIENNAAVPVFFAVSGVMLIIAVLQVSYSMAYLDELTGLPSRRALKEEMLKLGGKYVIAMMDIDFFKKFNDKYGHDVGDDVLKLVAGCIKRVGGRGKPFRYGGEEFTILFPNKTVNEAIPILEELREKVSKKAYDYKGKKNSKRVRATTKKLYVTISIGVAEKSERYKSAEEVIVAADKALYKAKKKGRNCVSK